MSQDQQFRSVQDNSADLKYGTPFFFGIAAPSNGSLPLFQVAGDSNTAPNKVARLLKLKTDLRRVVLGVVERAVAYYQ